MNNNMDNLLQQEPKQEGYWLFLDDIRQPRDAYGIIQDPRYLDNDDWVCVRNLEEFKDALKEFGIPSLVSYDHDLSPEHYNPAMYHGVEAYSRLYQGFKEPTGRECLELMLQTLGGNPNPEILIHTQNPAGRMVMLQMIANFERKQQQQQQQ